jgi:hypothetical protein
MSLLNGGPTPSNAALLLQLSFFALDAAFVVIDISAGLARSLEFKSQTSLNRPILDEWYAPIRLIVRVSLTTSAAQ